MTHSRNYRTLRHLILPALAGSALAALAFAPTFGAEPKRMAPTITMIGAKEDS